MFWGCISKNINNSNKKNDSINLKIIINIQNNMIIKYMKCPISYN